jgi:hypothetical protein
VRVNAGGRLFQTLPATLLKYPNSAFSTTVEMALNSRCSEEGLQDHDVFFDTDPRVFELVVSFLRTGKLILPVDNEPLRSEVVHFLSEQQLLEHAFPRLADATTNEDDAASVDVPQSVDSHLGLMELPDVCVVQLCDHMQHDQGVKRHAITLSYGADGFQLRGLAKRIRKDLNTQLASTYWQVYQTNERAAFFVTTKVANGTADLMTTSITQQVITHTEAMGYSLASSYVTLSPDVVHTNVRMLIHNFIFRRVRLPVPEASDALAVLQCHDGAEEGDLGEGDVDPSVQVHPNFDPPAVGPQASMWETSPPVVPPGQRLKNIWE